MSMVFIFLLVLLGISFLPFSIKGYVSKKAQEKPTVRIVINVLTICCALLLLSTFVLSYYNYYFIGYKTTTFILITTVLLFILHYIFTNYKNKIIRTLAPILLFIFIFISSLVVIINLVGFSDNKLFSSNEYRIESFRFIKTPRYYLPDLYVKKGVLEKKHTLFYTVEPDFGIDNDINKESISNYQILKTDSNYRVIFTFFDETTVTAETHEN